MTAPDVQETKKNHGASTLLRLLWMVGLALILARLFTPEKPTQREETFLETGRVAALQEGDPRVKITPPPPGSHGPSHFGDGSTTASVLLRNSPVATNELTMDDLRSTQLGRKPPPVFNEKLTNLNKKTVKMIGFMVPFDSLTDLRTFLMFENPMGCNFCVPPSPKEVVLVRMNKKTPQEFIDAPIEIEGTLDLWRDGSEDVAHRSFLYVINDATVKVAKDVKVNLGDGW